MSKNKTYNVAGLGEVLWDVFFDEKNWEEPLPILQLMHSGWVLKVIF